MKEWNDSAETTQSYSGFSSFPADSIIDIIFQPSEDEEYPIGQIKTILVTDNLSSIQISENSITNINQGASSKSYVLLKSLQEISLIEDNNIFNFCSNFFPDVTVVQMQDPDNLSARDIIDGISEDPNMIERLQGHLDNLFAQSSERRTEYNAAISSYQTRRARHIQAISEAESSVDNFFESISDFIEK